MSAEAVAIKAALFGLLTALSALAAHRGAAVYHDGLRTSVPGLMAGTTTREELGRYASALSLGFVFGYAIPFTLVSGITTIWIVLLAGDVIGIRFARLPVATAVAFAWGVVASVAVDMIWTLAILPLDGFGDALFTPLAYGFLMVGPLTAVRLHGVRVGLLVALVQVVVWRAADQLAGSPDPLLAWTLTGGAVGLVVTTIVLLGLAWWKGPASEAMRDIEAPIARIRHNWPLLVGPAALIAVVASQGWLAGDPFQVALVRLDAAPIAALAALWVAIAFFPLIAMTGVVSGVWNQAGYADWYLAAGFLGRHPLVAAGGAIAMVVIELVTFPFVARSVLSRPGIHMLATAARESMDDVAMFATVGGAVAAGWIVAGGLGISAVVGAVALNEARARPVLPAAAPLLGLLLIVAAVTIRRALTGA